MTQKVIKYYYAGSQRIAMRTDGVLNFILGDHLGSTSLVTDANGVIVSQQYYKAWGETRYTSGTEQTKYGYTGQYSYVTDFGLHFYNARWYDSSLSRFAQADSIIPDGVQGLDRYGYSLNNPIRFIDPTGHIPCQYYAGNYCDTPINKTSPGDILKKYNVTADEDFSDDQKWAIVHAVVRVGRRFTEERNRNETAAQAITSIFDGGINFTLGSENASGDCASPSINSGGCTSSSSQINFWSMAGEANNNMFTMIGNVVHELGHAYNNQLQKAPEKDMPNWMYDPTNPGRGRFLRPNSLAPVPNACDDCWYYQYNRTNTPTETFADMFVAWTYDTWNLNPDNAKQVQAAQTWMNGWMP